MNEPETYDLTTGRGLIACPNCDALHIEEELSDGETARCMRCNTVLARPRTGAFTQIMALSLTTMVLMIAALFFPFLKMSRMGIENSTSLVGVALAYSDGLLMPLTGMVVAMIVALPAFRAGLLIYVLWPLTRNRRPFANAAKAFRLSEMLRPWSMAEIFIIGTAIALVKLGGMAKISFGPAFWAFCGLIFVSLASRQFMCSTTIWDAIEDGGIATDGREMVPAAKGTA